MMMNPMSRAVDRLFEEAFAPFYSGRDSGNAGTGQTGVQSLPVTIWETEDAFHAALMAPGLDEDSINVTVQEDTLSVEGELKFEPPEGARMVWQEFAPARFRRSLRFGTPIDPNRVEAVYRNGLLMLTMPKSEAAKPSDGVPSQAGCPLPGSGRLSRRQRGARGRAPHWPDGCPGDYR
jgi:HSP20 family protein